MSCDNNCNKDQYKKVETKLQCKATAELCDEILDELNIPDPTDGKAISSLISETNKEIDNDIERSEAE